MRIAILGAGFAGLATAWHLLRYSQASLSIDFYDPNPIGTNASGLSSGLLHPYMGRHAHCAWEAQTCLKEAHALLTEASRALSGPIVIAKGILRPALAAEQIVDFQKCAALHTETEWWDAPTCMQKVPGLVIPNEGGGLFIKYGLTIDTQKYLQGLWQACALLGAQHYHKKVEHLEEMERYDSIVVTTGAMTQQFPLLKQLPLSLVKGQTLELQWPNMLSPPPFSLVGYKYLVMRPDHKTALVGATFEHHFTSLHPDAVFATTDIIPKLTQFFPSLSEATIVNCQAACRVSTPTRLPIAGRLNEKYYFFTGLGSKGLLYHAWVGKLLARTVLRKNTSYLPPQIFHDSKY